MSTISLREDWKFFTIHDMMMFEDCGNCIAMEQSGYISEWQNLLLTLTSYYYSITNQHPGGLFSYGNRTQIFNTKT